MKMRMKKNVYLLITMICLSMIVIIGCKKKKNEGESVINPVTAIEASAVNSTITVHWTPPTNSTPTEYKLYKDDVFIQTLTDTIFTENALSTGIFTYCVSAVYSSVESTMTCIIVMVSTVDYANIIKGSYVGDISTEMFPDTMKNVTIDFNYVRYNIATIFIDDTISTQGVVVPLSLDKEVYVLYNSESDIYHFEFETNTTVSIYGQEYTFPLIGVGVVTKDSIPKLDIDFTIETGIIGDVKVLYIGYKQ